MSAQKRERADGLLVARGLAPSRAKAQALILAGEVFAGGVRVEKSGQLLSGDAGLTVLPRRRFVSRGGEKLERALSSFEAGFGDVVARAREARGKVVAVDVGASTGGFTDCLLQRGVELVYAVDVGRGQLDARIASDLRVVARDRTNARDLKGSDFAEPIDLVVVDASFIGLDKLAPAIGRILRPEGWLVALVKPQFEAGKEAVRRGRGVIRDEGVRTAAIASATASLAAEGFAIVAEVDSEVAGPKGNVERFVLAQARVPEQQRS